MCGIFGSISISEPDQSDLLVRLETLVHRGPDGTGSLSYLEGGKYFFWGHQRLALIDLSDRSSQPMSFRGLTLVFNGEIYNYKELKKQLIYQGYNFSSQGDTEVLIKAWDFWGEACLQKLNGMFALAIHDKVQKKVFFARDRAGSKPLYYSADSNGFRFASEIRALKNSKVSVDGLNMNAVREYLSQGYCFGSETMFKGIFRLPRSSLLTIDLNSFSHNIIEYWRPSAEGSDDHSDVDSLSDHFLATYRDSVSLRLSADRPVGVFLSGGYDSALTAAVASEIRPNLDTFTVGFRDKKLDESGHAYNVAKYLGIKNHVHIVNDEEVRECVRLMPFIWDEPIADTSCIPMLSLSRLARKSVIGVLSADGADELFLGYNKYFRLKTLLGIRNKLPFTAHMSSVLAQILRFEDSVLYPYTSRLNRNYFRKASTVASALSAPDVRSSLLGYQNIFHDWEMDNLFVGDSSNELIIALKDHGMNYQESVMRSTDLDTYLPENVLKKVDRATMAFGLEGRDPFLDFRIMNFAFTSQCSKTFRHGPKALIKEAAHKLIPQSLLDRPKQGFSSPIDSWMSNLFESDLDHYFSIKNLSKYGFLNSNVLRTYYLRYRSGDKSLDRKIWSLFVFLLWMEQWVN
jgi:asparagine synthase (glutamine-hydrolysing)